MDTIEISFEWYARALLERFEELKKRGWVGDAEDELFPVFLGFLRDVGSVSGDPDPSVVVDNFCVNAVVISRDDFESYPEDYSNYGETWDDVWDNALIGTENYVMISF